MCCDHISGEARPCRGSLEAASRHILDISAPDSLRSGQQRGDRKRAILARGEPVRHPAELGTRRNRRSRGTRSERYASLIDRESEGEGEGGREGEGEGEGEGP